MTASSDGFVHRVSIAVGIAAFAALLVLSIWAALDAVLIIFGGILLAVLLRGLGDLLSEHTGISQGWSLALVGVMLVAIIGAGAWYLSGEIAGQFDELGSSLASLWEQLRAQLQKYGWGRQILSLLGAEESSPDKVNALGKFFGVVLGSISGLVISIFVGVYVAADPTLYRKGFLRLMPLRSRERTTEILDELHETLRWWLLGTLILMIVVGTATMVGLWLLGIPLALSLGIIAFFLEFIPYIGPILSAIPAVLIASTVGTREVLFVVLLYWAIQSVEGYVLSPLVFQKSVRIPPMLTIGAQVVLGTLFGVLGVVFATPLTASAIVLTKRLYVEDTLGDNLDRPLKQK
jgi:predicted PurR-regulated permease PerM